MTTTLSSSEEPAPLCGELNISIMEKNYRLVLYRNPGEVFYTLPQMKLI
jgi:hypothetical protein